MVDKRGSILGGGPILRLGVLNATSNYWIIQHQKFESLHGTTEGKGLCVRSSSIF